MLCFTSTSTFGSSSWTLPTLKKKKIGMGFIPVQRRRGFKRSLLKYWFSYQKRAEARFWRRSFPGSFFFVFFLTETF